VAIAGIVTHGEFGYRSMEVLARRIPGESFLNKFAWTELENSLHLAGNHFPGAFPDTVLLLDEASTCNHLLPYRNAIQL
jgi:hypothetical protein